MPAVKITAARSGGKRIAATPPHHASQFPRFASPLPKRDDSNGADTCAQATASPPPRPRSRSSGGANTYLGRGRLDALIVQAAIQAGAERLVSENLQHGRRFSALTIENPFRDE